MLRSRTSAHVADITNVGRLRCAMMRISNSFVIDFYIVSKTPQQAGQNRLQSFKPCPAAWFMKKSFNGLMALTALRPKDRRGTRGPLPTEYSL